MLRQLPRELRQDADHVHNLVNREAVDQYMSLYHPDGKADIAVDVDDDGALELQDDWTLDPKAGVKQVQTTDGEVHQQMDFGAN